MIAASPNERRVVGCLILFKAVYLILLSVAILLCSKSTETGASLPGQNIPNKGQTFTSHFLAIDCKYYIFLSENGYEHNRKECAFYPLYPSLIHWVSKITNGNDVWVGMVLANLFSFQSFILFFRIVARRYGEAVATLSLLLLLSFPGSLYFQFIYTESLFFLLLMLFLLGLEKSHFWLTLATALLLPLTRAVGIFCVFPLLWHLSLVTRPSRWEKLSNSPGWLVRIVEFVEPRVEDLSVRRFPAFTRLKWFYLVLAPCAGWVTYFVVMWECTGNAFEGFEAQKQFGGVQSIHNLTDPVRFVILLFNPTTWHEYTGSLLDRCMFILLIDCFPLTWRLDKSWCIWMFFLGVVPAVSGGFTSFTRYSSVVFPIFVAMAVFLIKPRMRWWRWLLLTAFVALHLILVWRFVNFKWA
jgi:hypothetical protein